jgi:electron transport complex protein RnfD
MKFIEKEKPIYRDKKAKTHKIMKHLLIGLLPVIFFAYYKHGLSLYFRNQVTFIESLRPLIMMLVGALTSVISEFIFYRVTKPKESLKTDFKNVRDSFAIFPGLFLALILPINTPYHILILGAVFASIVGKMLFGGFGKNIFNPALVGGLFLSGAYPEIVGRVSNYFNLYEIDTIGGVTPLTHLSTNNYIAPYETIVEPFGNLLDFFFGSIPGAIGETSAYFILIGFLYLVLKKVINARIPVIYISTVFVMTYIIGSLFDFGIWYPIFHILSGGLFFGAVYMATDPVTSPTTPSGQVLYALGLGILTVTFRFLTNYPEGVLTSILVMNMLTPIIDKKMGEYRHKGFKSILISVMIAILIGVGVIYAIYNRINSLNVPEEPTVEGPVELVETKNIEDETIYLVIADAFKKESIEAEVYVKDKQITKIVIISHKETPAWGGEVIEDETFINNLIKHQDNLEKVDTVSGVTRTADGLIEIVRFIKQEVIK